jgi:hypothetical protein
VDSLSVGEAAKALGVTQAAVYKRIQRGTIKHFKDDEGHVFVYLDPIDIPSDKSMDGGGWSTDRSTDRSMDESNSEELIAELRTHNQHLRQEIEAWREEARRKDAILMTMAQRIPELEPAREAPPDASSEPLGAPVGDSEEVSRGTGRAEAEEPVERPSFWRRLFLGE